MNGGRERMIAWSAFWICLAVFIVCDYKVFKSGADSAIWGYKTPAEKQLQQAIINSAEITKGDR